MSAWFLFKVLIISQVFPLPWLCDGWQGCRPSILVELWSWNHKPPLPCTFLISLSQEGWTETTGCYKQHFEQQRLSDFHGDLASLIHFKHMKHANSGKSRWGGLCIINSWCTNTKIVSRHWSLAMKYLTVKYRPYVFLGRSLTVWHLWCIFPQMIMQAHLQDILQMHPGLSQQKALDA